MNNSLRATLIALLATQVAVYAMDPIHAAAYNGDLETFTQYAAEGLPLNQRDAIGWTPAHYAVLAGHTTIIKMLQNQKVTLTKKDFFNRTLLHYAAKNGDTNMVDTLLFDGATKSVLDARDCLGWTPYDYANKYGDYQMEWAFMDAAQSGQQERPQLTIRKDYTLLQLFAKKDTCLKTDCATWFPRVVQQGNPTQIAALKAMIAPVAIIAMIEELNFQHY